MTSTAQGTSNSMFPEAVVDQPSELADRVDDLVEHRVLDSAGEGLGVGGVQPSSLLKVRTIRGQPAPAPVFAGSDK